MATLRDRNGQTYKAPVFLVFYFLNDVFRMVKI